MSRNQVNESVERVQLEEGDWIDVRVGVTWGDLTDLVDEALETAPGRLVRIKTGSLMAFQVRAGLVAWGGPGWTEADGSITPVSMQTIRKLPPQLAQRIHDEVTKRNPGILQAITGTSAAGKEQASAGSASSSPAADA